MERKREREEKAIMYVYERNEVFVIKMFYLFYLSLFIKICVMTYENDTILCACACVCVFYSWRNF